jgi:hypothetical protein
MALKVVLIPTLIVVATCFGWLFPHREQIAEDDVWDDVPITRDLDEAARARKRRLPG